MSTTVTITFPKSLCSAWTFMSEAEMKEQFQAMGVAGDDFDWSLPLDEIADEIADLADMSLFALAEEWCRDHESEISGPILPGIDISGPTVGDISQATKSEVEHVRHEKSAKEVAVYWNDSNAFRFTGELEVEDAFDFSKLEIKFVTTYCGGDAIYEVIYDGETVDLEEEEWGSCQPDSGFDFPDA